MSKFGIASVIAVSALIIGTVGKLQAGLIWDYSPGTTGATLHPTEFGNWSNHSLRHNFAEQIQFGTDVSLTGMDIYSGIFWGEVGDSATIRLWDDAGGLPGSLLLEFTETITIIDTDGVGSNSNINRKHVDFSNPINLTAGTSYWIGMSGTSVELTLAGLIGPNAPDDGDMFRFFGLSPVGFGNLGDSNGDMAFRLQGDIAAVPEPSSIALLSLGAIGMGLVAVRRRRQLRPAA